VSLGITRFLPEILAAIWRPGAELLMKGAPLRPGTVGLLATTKPSNRRRPPPVSQRAAFIPAPLPGEGDRQHKRNLKPCRARNRLGQLPGLRPRPTGTIRFSGAPAPVTSGSPQSWTTSQFSRAHVGRRIERFRNPLPSFFLEVAHGPDFITVTEPSTAPTFPAKMPTHGFLRPPHCP